MGTVLPFIYLLAAGFCTINEISGTQEPTTVTSTATSETNPIPPLSIVNSVNHSAPPSVITQRNCDGYQTAIICQLCHQSNQTIFWKSQWQCNQSQCESLIKEATSTIGKLRSSQISTECKTLILKTVCAWILPACNTSNRSQITPMCNESCYQLKLNPCWENSREHQSVESVISNILSQNAIVANVSAFPCQFQSRNQSNFSTSITTGSNNKTSNHSSFKLSHFLIKTCGGTVPNGTHCVFPFEYGGFKYNACTQVNAFNTWRHWCATKPRDYERHRKWGFCNCTGTKPGRLDATCEAYNGGRACMPYRSNHSIFVDNNFNQELLGENAMDPLKKALEDSDEEGKEMCLMPMIKTICNMVFPDCVTYANYSVYPKPICKESCYQFRQGICGDYFLKNTQTFIAHFSKYNPVHVYTNFPQCDELLSAKDSHISCTDIGIDLGYTPKPDIYQSSQSLAQTAGIVVGIVILVIVVTIVIIQVIQRRKGQRRLQISVSDNLEFANSNSSTFLPLSSSSSSKTVKDAVESCKKQNLQSTCWENDATATNNLLEYPLDKIKYVKDLGEGEFGKVFMGIIEDFNKFGTHPFPVAVKMLKASSSERMKDDFYKELHVMFNLCHPNIINLLAKYINDDVYCMVFEYMCHGDLNQFLRSSQIGEVRNIVEAVESDTQPKQKHTVTVDDLIYVIIQVSCGLSYLVEKRFVHRDIATRNCLVGTSMTTKIADFGLSRDVYTSDYYRVVGQALLPIRWMSPESILYGKFTPESDVWAFGVLMWEVFTLGKKPYYGQSNEEVIQHVTGGGKLPSPNDYCPSSIQKVMDLCWQQNVQDRPKATELPLMLEKSFKVE